METEQKPIALCEKACVGGEGCGVGGYFVQIQKKHMCHVLNEQGTGCAYRLNWKMGLSSERASKN